MARLSRWKRNILSRSIVLMTSTLCRMNGSSGMARLLKKKPGSLLQPAPGIEQDSSREISTRIPKLSFCLQIVDDHVGKVMHIDDDFLNPNERRRAA